MGPEMSLGTLGEYLMVLWSLLRHDTCLLDLHSWSNLVLSERMNRMNNFSLTCECVIHPPRGLGRRALPHWDKKHCPTSFLPGFSLIWLKCHQSQFLKYTIFQGSINLFKQMLVCHPSVVDAHPVCSWAVFMQIRGFATSHPPPWLGTANLASEKHLLLLQKVNCLSH